MNNEYEEEYQGIDWAKIGLIVSVVLLFFVFITIGMVTSAHDDLKDQKSQLADINNTLSSGALIQ